MSDEHLVKFRVIEKLPVPFPVVEEGKPIGIFDPDAFVPNELGVYLTPGRVSNLLKRLPDGWRTVVQVLGENGAKVCEYTAEDWLEDGAEDWREIRYHQNQKIYHERRLKELYEDVAVNLSTNL